MATVHELTRTQLIDALYSLATAYRDDDLQVGELVWVFHKSVNADWPTHGPLSAAVVTERLGETGRAVEVAYPDGRREKLKVKPSYGWHVVRSQAAAGHPDNPQQE